MKSRVLALLALGAMVLLMLAELKNDSMTLGISSLPTSSIRTNYSTAAIGALVSNDTNDIENLCHGLESLIHLNDARYTESAHVLVFHDGLHARHEQFLRKCTNRTVKFLALEYSFESDFPHGFDYVNETPNWRKRTKWGYQQMIRFWITTIWQHPALQSYETLLRLDSDACWTTRNNNHHLPGLPDHVDYHANHIFYDIPLVCQGFSKMAMDYVHNHDIHVQQPSLFHQTQPTLLKRIVHQVPGESARCPAFYNNFEVVRISFMQRPDVRRWHEAITEQEPFGVFRHRWGDAVERFLTISMFATNYIPMPPEGYSHPCENGLPYKRLN